MTAWFEHDPATLAEKWNGWCARNGGLVCLALFVLGVAILVAVVRS